jgi:hypothetical protein
MKGLQTRKKRFEEAEYTTNKKQKEDFASLIKRIGINELNYIMITINCPTYISGWAEQLRYLKTFLKRIKTNYVACLEWSDQRSNGYHLHLIISRELIDHINIPKTAYISELLVNNCLDRCLGYICKERKGCVVNEKTYFTNISERKLIPITNRFVSDEEIVNREKEVSLSRNLLFRRWYAL